MNRQPLHDHFWLYIWYRLDLNVDFIVFEARDLAVIEIIHLTSTDDLENRGQCYLLWTPCSSWVVYMIQDHFHFPVNYIRCWESQNDWNLSPDLHSWPPKSRSNIFSNDLYYLWQNTCYKLDFSIDFNIIDVKELKTFEINNVAMMVDLENDTNLEKVGLTLKIKVKHQG